MSTSMGSLVGGVSLALLSKSDEREPRWGFDFDLDALDCLLAGFAKKLMRLFCFMFSEEGRFSGASFCNGMVEPDA